MRGICGGRVARPCGEADGRVRAIRDRPIEGDRPGPWVDATHPKARRGGRIVPVAVVVAVGVESDGRREMPGQEVGRSGAQPIRTEVWRKPTRRGLRGVKLGVCAAHGGLEAVVAKVPSAIWRGGRLNLEGNGLADAGKSGRCVVSAFDAFARKTPKAGGILPRAFADRTPP